MTNHNYSNLKEMEDRMKMISEMERVIYECCDVCMKPKNYAESDMDLLENSDILKESAIIEAMGVMYDMAEIDNDYAVKLMEKCSLCKFHKDVSGLIRYMERG
jgi:hypothetical protein